VWRGSRLSVAKLLLPLPAPAENGHQAIFNLKQDSFYIKISLSHL
jgi:hypothetical protein